MPKKRTSFSIAEQYIVLLKLLAEKNDRSAAGMLEQLIKEAAKKADIKLPKS